jgi:hypothetical protein
VCPEPFSSRMARPHTNTGQVQENGGCGRSADACSITRSGSVNLLLTGGRSPTLRRSLTLTLR